MTSNNACLIVERLRPLEYSLDDGFEKDEILSGLCDIFDAVLFLHEKVYITFGILEYPQTPLSRWCWAWVYFSRFPARVWLTLLDLLDVGLGIALSGTS